MTATAPTCPNPGCSVILDRDGTCYMCGPAPEPAVNGDRPRRIPNEPPPLLSAVAPDSARSEDDLASIASRYTPVDWAQAWKEQPADVDWLLEPVLETGTINVLFARPGTGKSLLALEMALRLVREDHTVVYVDDENRITDLVERLQAFGASPDELGGLVLYSFAGLPALDTPAGGAHLLALAVKANASLVVIDTTSRMIEGNENDATTFLQLYRCSLVPLKKRGITVLRLDHPGKDDGRGQRGSSAKDGDADTIWKLAEEAKGLRYVLHRDKSRSGHGDADEIRISRRYTPLRHEWAVPDSDRENKITGQVCGQLSDLGVPPSAGRDRCRTALAKAGIQISNAQLSKVIRQRKYAPDSSGTGGQPSASAADCPRLPNSLGLGTRTGEQTPVPDSEQWPGNSPGAEAQP